MDTTVFLAVLCAAFCHAGWNAAIKLRLEPLLALVLISVACGVAVLPFLPAVGLLPRAAWPYIGGSLAVHLVYYWSLAEAYRTGDLGLVYPVARGTAPLLTAAGASLLLGESLGIYGWAGVTTLAAGILLLSMRGGRDVTAIDTRAIRFALLTALSIAIYTVIDGAGARASPAVGAYIVWLFLLDALMMLVFGLFMVGAPALRAGLAQSWRLVLVAGALSTVSYAIAIWAMTKAPVALVAAVRETSVLFAALIGIVLLGEPILKVRLIASAAVIAGLVLMRLR